MFYTERPKRGARLPTGDVLALSERQREILVAMANGLSNREIAARLLISQNTLSHHITSIYAKLGGVTRSQAILRAIRAGLVDPHRPEEEVPSPES